jgi:NAD(P)-dependent dehydrogenase (short-subunit alcohol dehydrogenase family)
MRSHGPDRKDSGGDRGEPGPGRRPRRGDGGARAPVPGALAMQLDVRDAAAVDRFAAAVAERFGSIDLWINNAGVLDPIGPLVEVSPADFARHI